MALWQCCCMTCARRAYSVNPEFSLPQNREAWPDALHRSSPPLVRSLLVPNPSAQPPRLRHTRLRTLGQHSAGLQWVQWDSQLPPWCSLGGRDQQQLLVGWCCADARWYRRPAGDLFGRNASPDLNCILFSYWFCPSACSHVGCACGAVPPWLLGTQCGKLQPVARQYRTCRQLELNGHRAGERPGLPYESRLHIPRLVLSVSKAGRWKSLRQRKKYVQSGVFSPPPPALYNLCNSRIQKAKIACELVQERGI